MCVVRGEWVLECVCVCHLEISMCNVEMMKVSYSQTDASHNLSSFCTHTHTQVVGLEQYDIYYLIKMDTLL